MPQAVVKVDYHDGLVCSNKVLPATDCHFIYSGMATLTKNGWDKIQFQSFERAIVARWHTQHRTEQKEALVMACLVRKCNCQVLQMSNRVSGWLWLNSGRHRTIRFWSVRESCDKCHTFVLIKFKFSLSNICQSTRFCLRFGEL